MSRSPLAVLALAATLAAPAAADAADGSITYVSGGNVFLVGPAGATPRQITTDGAASTYISPSAKDDGTIVAGQALSFSAFSPDGTRLGGPFPADDMKSGCSSVGPVSAQVEPQGARIVYAYLYHGCGGIGGIYPGYTPYVGFANSGAPTGNADFPEFNPYEQPRWIGGTGTVAAVKGDGSEIATFGPGSVPGTAATLIGAAAGEDIEAFDVARNGQDWLIQSAPEGAGIDAPGTLSLWRGGEVCRVGLGTAGSKPRWSPDGTAFTWHDAQGVWVSPAPSGAGTCAIAPTLIAPGGAHPDWGAANLPGSGLGGTGGTGGDATKPRAKLVRSKMPALATALKRGFRIRLRTDEAGRATVTASLSGATARRYKLTKKQRAVVVAKATKKLTKAGTHTVTLRFTTTAKRKLRRAKRLTLTVRATVTDAAGNRGTATTRTTLKVRR